MKDVVRKPYSRIGTGSSWWADLLIMLALTFMVGCSDGPVKTVPVEGRITYGKGDWPAEGMIYFAPLEPAVGFPHRGGSAAFGRNGNFSATTFQKNDGLIPGRYAINLLCSKTPPGPQAPQGESYVPQKYLYGRTSGLVVDVPADERDKVVVEVDVSLPGK